MAEETFRIEIPIEVEDNTEPALSRAEERVTKFEITLRRTQKQLERMDRSRWEMTLYAVDRASAVIGWVGSRVQSLVGRSYHITIRVLDLATRPLRAIGRMAFSVGGLIAGAGAGYGGILKPLSLADDLTSASIGFETMLNSVEKAQDLMAKIQQFAQDTPFGSADVIKQAQNLLVRGFGADEVIPMLNRIGNATSALGRGADNIDRIVLALGQMRANGRVTAEDMNQLTDAGIQAWKYVADGMGKTQAEVRKLSENGLLPANDAIQLILKGMEQFDGMMQKNANLTARGLASQLLDVFNMKILTKWGQGLQSAVLPRLQQINEWVDKNQDKIKRWGEVLERTARDAADWVLRKFETSFGYIQRMYLDNPDFQKLDFEGKIKFVFNDLNRLFNEWWQESGKQQVEKISSKIGGTIGGALGGFIMAALGATDPTKAVSDSPFIQAGATAGNAFLTSFLESFDAGKIAEKAVEAFKNIQPTWLGGGNSSGTGQVLALMLDAWLISKLMNILSGPGKVIRGGAGLGKKAIDWFRGKRGGGTGISGGTGPTGGVGPRGSDIDIPKTPDAPKMSPILDQYGRPLPSTISTVEKATDAAEATKKASLWSRTLEKVGGFGSKSKGLLKRVPYLGLAIGALDVATAFGKPKQERNRAIGGAIGGWGGAAAGAAAGAAIGSVVPGLGTAIGGVIGGIVGGFGGGVAGDWLGSKWDDIVSGKAWDSIKRWSRNTWDDLKQVGGRTWSWISDTAPQSIARGIGFAVGYIGDTLFNGDWWSAKWDAVKTWASDTWEGAKKIWNNTKEAIGSTIFNGEWWGEKWTSVKTWASNTWESAKDIWNSVTTSIGDTVFNKDWWGEKWDNVKTWASNAWESIKSGWGSFWDRVSGAFKEGKEAGEKAAALPGHATGGIFSRPHIAMFAESGREAVIPLDQYRNRALGLWMETGRQLGVRQYAAGGFTGGSADRPPVRVYSPASAVEGRTSINLGGVSLGGVNVSFRVEGGDESSIMSAIQKHGREIADVLADELGRALEDVMQNLPATS
ncbi:tape measure protein [Paenibacillus naphthalenovorans]|uniref:tape measure protein n=1 Tax=Paenibacillus naphthalenovorans TaxID=162209 RepID=UPI003D2AC14F